MMELKTYFDGMAKPMLRDVHARAYGKNGLLNNALIQSEVFSFYSSQERINSLLKKLEPWQKRCLELIYTSGPRGMSFSELRLSSAVVKSAELQNFLISLCKQCIIWRSKTSNTIVYFGFKDFFNHIKYNAEFFDEEQKSPLSYGLSVDWHICKILGLAQRGELKVNANGTLNRRSHQLCIDSFKTISHFWENAAETELILIFSFLTQNKWLQLENSNLYPSPKALEFLKKNGFRLHHNILSWWLSARFLNDRFFAKQIFKSISANISALDATKIFWVLDPTYRITEKRHQVGWDCLPRPLKEAFLLGVVDFSLVEQKSGKKISKITLNESGEEWLDTSVMPMPEPSISLLPNFDIIASIGTSPRILFLLSTLATSKNDETFLSFNLNKESYLSGLKSGFPESEIEHFCNAVKMPANVSATLEDWNNSFYGAKIKTVRLLKIQNINVLRELSEFPAFMEHIDEYIPNYGFILKSEKETQVNHILENYGFSIGKSSLIENREDAPTEEWKKDFVIPHYEAQAPDYDLKDSSTASLQSSLEGTKYDGSYKKLDTFDLVKVLRFAKMTGTMLGAQIKDPKKKSEQMKEIMFYVHSLHLSKAPFNADIQEAGGGSEYSLMLSFIQEVKVMQPKQA